MKERERERERAHFQPAHNVGIVKQIDVSAQWSATDVTGHFCRQTRVRGPDACVADVSTHLPWFKYDYLKVRVVNQEIGC
jgi:hypothetical protein